MLFHRNQFSCIFRPFSHMNSSSCSSSWRNTYLEVKNIPYRLRRWMNMLINFLEPNSMSTCLLRLTNKFKQKHLNAYGIDHLHNRLDITLPSKSEVENLRNGYMKMPCTYFIKTKEKIKCLCNCKRWTKVAEIKQACLLVNRCVEKLWKR